MSHLGRAIEVFNIELEELNSALVRLEQNDKFDSLIDALCQENSRVIVIGMGNNCTICQGKGKNECKRCMGSGYIAKWRK